VFAPEPKPDLYLLDKLYINAVKENVDLIIVVNKQDVGDQVLELIRNEYKDLGIEILSVSSKTGVGILELKEKLKGKLSVLAGQSAAGKTSIVNAMFGLNLKTGELSEKILRGKHTTTRSEIFEQDDIKLIDSPGFAVLDADVDVDEIIECYPEYFEVSKYCKFRGCTHISEPDCKVKELVDSEQFSKERYVRYVEIYNDIAKRRKIYEKD
ncbi:MAG: ribosome small subunit-dependent GTPase A, partial [Clostridia bacterium]|nr:ribosome small subunit-dependent GTPase A [Clostridia bacterium]